ncbi:GNAT family N-acetyltransferase, partial [Methylobacterium trifolii]
WLAARAERDGGEPQAARAFLGMTEALVLPRAFAALRHEGGIVAIAYAVLDRSLVVIESVATPEPLRGRGHARRVVGALMRWAHGQGAAGACLQVVAENPAANALYAALGFSTELYRYHYRQRDIP